MPLATATATAAPVRGWPLDMCSIQKKRRGNRKRSRVSHGGRPSRDSPQRTHQDARIPQLTHLSQRRRGRLSSSTPPEQLEPPSKLLEPLRSDTRRQILSTDTYLPSFSTRLTGLGRKFDTKQVLQSQGRRKGHPTPDIQNTRNGSWCLKFKTSPLLPGVNTTNPARIMPETQFCKQGGHRSPNPQI